MSRSHPRRCSRDPAARIWAWVSVLLLLCAGLSQRLVLCTWGDGVTHLEFAHAEGDCHAHAQPAGAPGGGAAMHAAHAPDAPDAPDAPADTPHHDGDPTCSHVGFAIVLQTAPRPDAVGAPHDRCAHDAPLPPEPPRAPIVAPPPHPSTTGPPRPRGFLARLACTVLLL